MVESMWSFLAVWWPVVLAGAVSLGAAFTLWRFRALLRPPAPVFAYPGFADAGPGAAGRGRKGWMKAAGLKIWRMGPVGIALLASTALVVASFFTTYQGYNAFSPNGIVSLFAAFGIQTLLFVFSWIVAMSSASHANRRAREYSLRQELEDGEVKSRTNHYADFVLYIWRHPISVLALVLVMLVSVGFSFNAYLEVVYSEKERTQNSLKISRSQIGSVFAEVQAKMGAAQAQEVDKLSKSEAWRKYEADLSAILRIAENAKDEIERSLISERGKIDNDLGVVRAKYEERGKQVAELEARLNSLRNRKPGQAEAASSDSQNRLAALAARVDDLGKAIAELEVKETDLKAKRNEEEKAGGVGPDGKRRKATCGRVCKDLDRELVALRANLQPQRDARDAAKAEMDKLRRAQDLVLADAGKVEAELVTKRGELGQLKIEVEALDRQHGLTTAQAGDASSGASAAASYVARIRKALTGFIGAGDPAAYKEMADGCSGMVDLLSRTESLKKQLAAYSCSTSNFGKAVADLDILNARIVWYNTGRRDAALLPAVLEAPGDASGARADLLKRRAENAALPCAADDAFNEYPTVGDIADRARACLSRSALPGRIIAPERDLVDLVEQENSPDASPFRRAYATLKRGDSLSLFALFLAAMLDIMVFLAALGGAKALSSPLVASGAVGNSQELEEHELTTFYDSHIYDDDPPNIRNKKKFLSLIKVVSGKDGAGELHELRMEDVPPPDQALFRGQIASLSAGKEMPLVEANPRAPMHYRINKSLIAQWTQDVGRYIRDNPRAAPGRGMGGGGHWREEAHQGYAGIQQPQAAPAEPPPEPRESVRPDPDNVIRVDGRWR